MGTGNAPDVPQVPGIDLDFEPREYFTSRALGFALPSDIKGQARRNLARRLAGAGSEIPSKLLAAELDEDDRLHWGAVNPALMGGEYLPKVTKGAVEIARVSIASVTADQISVRARRTPAGIAYSIVDEYGTRYRVKPRVRPAPLSMRELVDVMDECDGWFGIAMGPAVRALEGQSDPESVRDFVRVESDFYPQLQAYYDARLEQLFAEYAAEMAAQKAAQDG
jgi:hypothetical protein